MGSPAAEDKDYTAQRLNTNRETASRGICERDPDESFASRLYNSCVAEFRGLCQYKERQIGPEASKSSFWDELARLYMWGEYFRDGELDMALTPSEELASKVISLLSAIGKKLLKHSPLIVSSPDERNGDVLGNSELSSLIEQADIILSRTNGEERFAADDWADQDDSDSDAASIEEEAEFCEDIEFNTRCLMQLVPALEQNIISSRKPPTPIDRHTSHTFLVSEPARAYISLVQQTFQKADVKLVQRLAEANWQRHERRLYGHGEERNEPSAHVACSVFHDSGLGTTVPESSQHAPSLASHASSASSVGKQESSFLGIPPMPPEVISGQNFLCTLCGTTQSHIRNSLDWKRHVFHDLKPYICTFPECSLELVQFSTRVEWAEHEFSCHRFVEEWHCPLCPQNIHDRRDCEQHLEHSHGLLPPELAYWTDRAWTRKARAMSMEECLLCRTVPAEGRQAFIKHCCQHMEEIALMAMPPIAEDGSESNEDNHDEDRWSRSSESSLHINSWDTGALAGTSMAHVDSTIIEHASAAIPREHVPILDDDTRSRIGVGEGEGGGNNNGDGGAGNDGSDDDWADSWGASNKKKKGKKAKEEEKKEKEEEEERKRAEEERKQAEEERKKAEEETKDALSWANEEDDGGDWDGFATKKDKKKKHMEPYNSPLNSGHPCTAMNGVSPCNKIFQSKKHLQRHYNSMHIKAPKYICAHCGSGFARRDTLGRHTEDGCPKKAELGFRETNDQIISTSSQAALDQESARADPKQTDQRKTLDYPEPDQGSLGPLDQEVSSHNVMKPRSPIPPPGRCHSCNRASTPEWRRGPDGPGTLCNACGIHYAKLTQHLATKNAGDSSNSRGQDPSLIPAAARELPSYDDAHPRSLPQGNPPAYQTPPQAYEFKCNECNDGHVWKLRDHTYCEGCSNRCNAGSTYYDRRGHEIRDY